MIVMIVMVIMTATGSELYSSHMVHSFEKRNAIVFSCVKDIQKAFFKALTVGNH